MEPVTLNQNSSLFFEVQPTTRTTKLSSKGTKNSLSKSRA